MFHSFFDSESPFFRFLAYFASMVRLFRFSGLPVRFNRSEIIGEAAKLESQYFRCPGLQQPKPLQAGIHPI